MKEKYEELKMEVIAFDGEIFTEDAYSVVIVSGDYTPGNNNGPFLTTR